MSHSATKPAGNTWADILPLLIGAIMHGNELEREQARRVLYNMAEAADTAVKVAARLRHTDARPEPLAVQVAAILGRKRHAEEQH